jgi:hypothetical protein
VSEFEVEPVPGLPEELPEGESLRWQGAPRWGVLAVRAFHARTVAIYFGILIALRLGYLVMTGAPGKVALLSGLWLAIMCLLAVGILTLLAWAFARSTIYSITNRRVVIRFGVALPMAINIPFKAIESVGLRRYADGTGDIPMVLGEGHSVNFLIMWPNVRPWRFFDAQPMLRGVPDVDKVAEELTDALRSATAADQADGAQAEQTEPRQRGSDGANGGSTQLGTAPAPGR